LKESSLVWDDVWRKHKYISDYMLRWYDFLSGLSKEYLPDKKRVLETGCGSAGGIVIFARDGHDASGIDISSVAIEKARKEYPSVNFLCENLFEMPFADESFDLVFNSGLIEHFKYPENIKAIKAMVRVLKPGGRLIMAAPNTLCLWYILGKKLLIKLGKWSYGYEDSYSPYLFKKYISEVTEIKLEKIHGIQSFPMVAFPGFELVPLRYRKVIAQFEKMLPFKEYYSYAIVAECKKVE
jgi:SAM-dependent methyltransferase